MCISHHMRGKATERLKQLHQQEMAVTMVCATDVETTVYMLIFGTQSTWFSFFSLLSSSAAAAVAVVRVPSSVFLVPNSAKLFLLSVYWQQTRTGS